MRIKWQNYLQWKKTTVSHQRHDIVCNHATKEMFNETFLKKHKNVPIVSERVMFNGVLNKPDKLKVISESKMIN